MGTDIATVGVMSSRAHLMRGLFVRLLAVLFPLALLGTGGVLPSYAEDEGDFEEDELIEIKVKYPDGKKFFPTVRDGYKDTIRVKWEDPNGCGDASDTSPNYDESGTVNCGSYEVRDSVDQVVATGKAKVKRDCYLLPWWYEWRCILEDAVIKWDGKVKGGKGKNKWAPVGDYTIVWTLDEYSFNAPIEVATKKVWKTATKSVKRPVKRSTQGTCFISAGSYGTHLDCWGGKHAQATFKVKYPKGSKVVSAKLKGRVGCCDSGKLTRKVNKPRKRAVTATVRVTGMRSYSLDRFVVKYRWQRVY